MFERAVVHIVDDDLELAASIAQVLRLVKIEAVSYGSAADFLEKYEPGVPGCLVTDIRMPGMSGTELQEKLFTAGDQLPVIVISGCADVATAVRVMKAGARDIFEKGGSMHVLIEAIQTAVQADLKRREEDAAAAETRQRFTRLSPREKVVLSLIVAGRTNKAVAEMLGISSNTVEIHRSRVMEKMGAENLAGLVKACVYAGLDREDRTQDASPAS